jgi:hypothetical protein
MAGIHGTTPIFIYVAGTSPPDNYCFCSLAVLGEWNPVRPDNQVPDHFVQDLVMGSGIVQIWKSSPALHIRQIGNVLGNHKTNRLTNVIEAGFDNNSGLKYTPCSALYSNDTIMTPAHSAAINGLLILAISTCFKPNSGWY